MITPSMGVDDGHGRSSFHCDRLGGPVEKADAAATCTVASDSLRSTYAAFDGHSETLTPWEGANVAGGAGRAGNQAEPDSDDEDGLRPG